MKRTNTDTVFEARLSLITARFVAFSDRICPKNDTKFAKQLNISRPALSSMRNKRGFVTLEHIVKLIEKQPNVNVNWLFRGEGDMFTDNFSNVNQTNAHIIGNNLSPNGTFSQIDPAISAVLTKQTEQISTLLEILSKK